jgi:hypothetical protein
MRAEKTPDTGTETDIMANTSFSPKQPSFLAVQIRGERLAVAFRGGRRGSLGVASMPAVRQSGDAGTGGLGGGDNPH